MRMGLHAMFFTFFRTRVARRRAFSRFDRHALARVCWENLGR